MLRPRSYADDLHASIRTKTARALCHEAREVFGIAQEYSDLSGGRLHRGKCYFFGSVALQNAVPVVAHKLQLRLVGAPMVAPEVDTSLTPVELLRDRRDKFKKIVERVDKLP